MITVAEAEQLILAQTRDNFGSNVLYLGEALGGILAEDIVADRDLPPFNRVTMDGIAIRLADYENGIRSFAIAGTQAAGDQPIENIGPGACVEIMTGAALPSVTDAVVPYEDIEIKDGIATITRGAVRPRQNIHPQGIDRKKGDIILKEGTVLDASATGIAATVGKSKVLTRCVPHIAIISTGDELVGIDETPDAYQLRRSNDRALAGALLQLGIPVDTFHLPDDPLIIAERLTEFAGIFDALILTGGVSMGKYDHLPKALAQLGVRQLFHKVQQRPGKPFWFGVNDKVAVFAFPGNPVSSFMCLHRYFLPWFRACMGISPATLYAVLGEDVVFTPNLVYMMQVRVTSQPDGRLTAMPVQGNGSGDLANLVDSNAFMELPQERSNFMKGEVFRIWPFKPLF